MTFETPSSPESNNVSPNPFEGVKYVTVPPKVDEETGKYILFHGSPAEDIEDLTTPTGKGDLDVTAGGAIYLSSDESAVTRYATESGAVYEVLVRNPVLYAEQRRQQGLPAKANRFLRNVFIASPDDVEIRQKINPRNVAPETRKAKKQRKNKRKPIRG